MATPPDVIPSLEAAVDTNFKFNYGSTFGVPDEIGCYSVKGEQREYDSTPCNRMHLRADIKEKGKKWNTPDWDVYEGFGDRVWRDWTKDDDLEHLLRWVLSNKDKVMSPPAPDSTPDFICSREVLKAFMCTPFCPTDEWRVAARLHKGVVYLRNIVLETEKERFSKELQGSKPPGWNGSFHRRMTTTLRIVFEAEVMAVCPSPESKEGPLYQYVEFRARQDFDGSLKKENFYRRARELEEDVASGRLSPDWALKMGSRVSDPSQEDFNWLGPPVVAFPCKRTVAIRSSTPAQGLRTSVPTGKQQQLGYGPELCVERLTISSLVSQLGAQPPPLSCRHQ
ncbi:uncharacterized protein LOC119400160 [Rhipicephalus sanguineus]|uniref:uncharacterized protein LOC119400160 n=1 Tax=Rhipicephalus sanguineus TaxID=34632 RepID=UPI0020C370EA|nr:uncharacterized protein LOC119400160 [Rhipicephalus sanguineus]